jgi:hypothetical protein
MSQINVDTILPFTVGNDVVTVKGIKMSLNNDTMQINTSAGLSLVAQGTMLGKGSRGGDFGSTANTCVGYNTGFSLSSGSANTFVGAAAGGNCSSGLSNTFIGNNAGSTVTTGNNNVLIGSGSGNSAGTITGQSNTCLGGSPSTGSVSNEITLGGPLTGALRCAVTTITSLSDARDKKDITDLRVGLDFVKSLRPVEFVWDDRREEGRHDVADFGFIAQDLKAAQEDIDMADTLKLVYESNPERLEASYGKLVPVLVQAIKDLAAKVETLENKKK